MELSAEEQEAIRKKKQAKRAAKKAKKGGEGQSAGVSLPFQGCSQAYGVRK